MPMHSTLPSSTSSNSSPRATPRKQRGPLQHNTSAAEPDKLLQRNQRPHNRLLRNLRLATIRRCTSSTTSNS